MEMTMQWIAMAYRESNTIIHNMAEQIFSSKYGQWNMKYIYNNSLGPEYLLFPSLFKNFL